MKKVSDFEKKYPLFVPYVKDEATRTNMLTNEDLMRKYKEHLDEIQDFVTEIALRFDIETVFSLLQATVFKLPDAILLSFIKAYLNSSEAAKNNQDVIKFYNNTLHLGDESIRYVERHGIITNRTWRDIPEMVIDDKYETLKKNNEIFKNEILDHAYGDLNIKEKKLVIGLLKREAFGLLNTLFAGVDITFRNLLALLSAKGINEDILNYEVARGIGEYNLLLLLFAIFNIESPEVVVNNVRHLIARERFALLNKLTAASSLVSLGEYNPDMLDDMTDEQFIEDISKKGYNLLKKDE